MRWWHGRGANDRRVEPVGGADAAQQALEESQKALQNAAMRWGPVIDVQKDLDYQIERNHLADRIEAAMSPRRKVHPPRHA